MQTAAPHIASTALRRLCRSADGNIALLFGLAFPVLLGAAGMAIDSAAFYNQQSRMQTVADSTALSVAKELNLFAEGTELLIATGESRAEALLVETGLAHRPHETEVSIDLAQGTATVEISMVAEGFLPPEIWGQNPIVVSAVARTFGETKLCVLALHESSSDTLKADNGAILTAPDCAIQANSNDPSSMVAKNRSAVVSLFTCTSGGFDGDGFLPEPETDCPPLEDPLETRAPPPVGGCDFLDFTLEKGTQTIVPGHYCGGLTLKNHADVIAEPGIYVISGGKLEVGNQALLRGEYVGFYFADDAATLVFKDQALVELSAPKDGPMAGLLFFENPGAAEGRSFEVSSNAARELLGTIYLPRGVFKSSGIGIIAEASAYTIIVAGRLDLSMARLVLNANYDASDVPVPSGIGPWSQKVTLDQ